MRRYDTAGGRCERPTLAVPAPNGRCGKRTTIDEHVIGDFDTLPRKGCDRLDQRRKATGTKTSAQISAPPCFCKDSCYGWA